MLAVVPIFVNAGTAVLPAVLGGIASVAGLLFKPAALAAAVKKRPAVALGVVATIGLVIAGATWLLSGGEAKAHRAQPQAGQMAGVPQKDWAEVAKEILRRDELARLSLTPTSMPTGTARVALGLGRDSARCADAGGPDPLDLVLLWPHKEMEEVYLSSPLVAGDKVYCATFQADPAGNLVRSSASTPAPAGPFGRPTRTVTTTSSRSSVPPH